MVLIMASNPEHPEQFKTALEKTRIVYDMEFLNARGKPFFS